MLDQKPARNGAQVAAEAMPYHMRRRTECNTGLATRAWLSSGHPARHPVRSAASVRNPDRSRSVRSQQGIAAHYEV
jgi:hypothetical protein